jgi:hypothetical protein
MDRRIFIVYALIWMVVAPVGPMAFGQTRDLARVAVDVVHLKNRKQIRGLVLSTNPSDELTVAVSCEWYEKEDRDAYLRALENAKQGAVKARLQLRDRLERTLAPPGQADGQVGLQKGAFQFFLKKELERVDSEIQNPPVDDIQFLLIGIKSAAISSLSRANDSNRKIALWSWYERLVEVESRKPNSLNAELNAKKINVTSTPPNLATRFYASEESEEQWTVRLAIVSHRLDKPIEFQGTGALMFLVGNGQPPDIASLMGQMMQSQASSLLEELSGSPKKPNAITVERSVWVQSAVAQAEKRQASYFRATHVRMETLHDTAAVDSVFMVKHESGKWTTAWQSNSVQYASEQKEDALTRITNDPQIKAIQTQFEGLGGTGGSMDKAIRMGAATMAAQRFVNDEFQLFTEGYLNRLSGPPIQVGK